MKSRKSRDEIANTPYNKSTEAHIGRLKSKLAEKKEKLETQQSGSGGGGGYSVEKHGATRRSRWWGSRVSASRRC